MIYFDVSTLNPEKITGVGVYMLQLLKHFHAHGLPVQPVLKISRWKKKAAIEKLVPQKSVQFLFPWARFKADDVYHGPDFKLSAKGPCARIVTVHDMVVFEEKYNAPAFYQKGIRDLTATLTKNPLAAVLVNSQFTKSEVLKYFPQLSDRVHVTYLGCEREKPHRTERHLDLPEKYVLFVGTLEKRKNVLGVLAAFEKFKDQGFADYKLILAGGEGFEFGDVEKALANSKYQKDIQRLYYVSDAHLHELYSRAQVFLFPSFYEGFGIPVLEAMALDCPVVTSAQGALAEICGSAALLAPPTATDALAAHLVSLARDPALRADLVKRGFNRSSAFSWEKCATETRAVYKQVVEKR